MLKNRADDRLMMKLGNVQKILTLQDYTVEGLLDHMMGFMDDGDEAGTFLKDVLERGMLSLVKYADTPTRSSSSWRR